MLTRLLRRQLAPHRARLGLLVLLQLVSVIAALYLPSLNARVIDDGVATGDTGTIWRLGGVMLAVSLVQIIASVAATYLAARTAATVAGRLRSEVFHRVGEFSAQEVSRFGPPTLIARSTNDVQQVQLVVFMGAAMMVMAPIMMVGGIFMALREDAGLAWLVAVAVPVLGIIVGLASLRMVPQFRLMQVCIDAVNRILREQITGIRVVRAFVREEHEEARFAEANARYTGTSLAVGKLMAIVFPAVMLVFNLSTVAVIWFGAHRVEAGATQMGQVIAFMSYMMQILMSVMMAVMMTMMIPRASVSAGRITEVLDTSTSVRQPERPEPIRVLEGTADQSGPGGVEVAFERVSFHYPGAEHPVLREVTFTARPGETTAIIGSTGAGKTTLTNLVPRLYDATEGRVLVGGTDVRDAALEDVWAHVGLVPQKPYLFSGTVASNLRYGAPEATDDELWEALRIAQGADFVRGMPAGLESPIAQGGTNVSGGQRQRLAIARALVRRPEIYLFDDSFSALDLATDARLRAALTPVTRDATVIVVAQRVSTIIDADQIVVLDDGRVVGIGTHDELLSGCPTYAEIVESQRPAQEAA